jgi:hypothetical protein
VYDVQMMNGGFAWPKDDIHDPGLVERSADFLLPAQYV